MGEFVTQQQFGELMAEMRTGFQRVEGLIGELKSQQQLDAATQQQEFDRRYRMVDAQLKETLVILDDPCVRKKSFQIIDEYMRTEDAERSISEVQRKLMRTARDETSKWINFVKAIVGIAAVGITVYFGITVNEIAQAIQKMQ